MVEIVGGIARHAKLLHDSARSRVGWNRERHDFIKTQALESVLEHCQRSLRRQTFSPVFRCQSPAEFYAWSEHGASNVGMFKPTNPTKVPSRRSSAAQEPNP